MTLKLSMYTCSAGLTILVYGVTESGLGVVLEDETYCFILTRISRQYVIMPVMKYMEIEVRRVGDIYKEFMMEEAVRG